MILPRISPEKVQKVLDEERCGHCDGKLTQYTMAAYDIDGTPIQAWFACEECKTIDPIWGFDYE